MFKMHFIAFW